MPTGRKGLESETERVWRFCLVYISMDNTNIIRIDNLDAPVYRIFPLHRVAELFNNRELVLVAPRMWDDPFENYFLKCTVRLEDGTLASLDRIADSWFGQCWTTNSDTDAMWRIYSGDNHGLRIRTSLRKLADAIWDEKDTFCRQKFYIGCVDYLERFKIEEAMKNTTFFELVGGGQSDRLAESLLTKRIEFAHESEVRILARDTKTDDAAKRNGIYRIPINPHDLVEEVCIDPRIVDPLDVECLEKKIKRTGFGGPIIQSDLYQISPATIPVH